MKMITSKGKQEFPGKIGVWLVKDPVNIGEIREEILKKIYCWSKRIQIGQMT